MNYEQFLEVNKPTKPLELIVSAESLEDQTDRTLIWGYTLDRHSHHVYLKDGVLHLCIYTGRVEVEIIDYKKSKTFPVKMLVPSKRAYPEACDYEFCRLLHDMGVRPTFTTFNPDRPPKQYHGEVLYQ